MKRFNLEWSVLAVLQNEHTDVTTSQLKIGTFPASRRFPLLSPGHHPPHTQLHSYFCYLRFVFPVFELSVNGVTQPVLFDF